ncbi:MAG: ABC transporter substrate-binding protein [Burkholderiales bacterium]|nr:ABC transporter substrate-binding protein [Burkholderiales bacterium]
MTPIARRQILAALLAAPLVARAQKAPLKKVTVAGWSKPITEIIPLLVDEDRGFYKAQGLDLGYVPGAGSADAVRNILSGQADVAFCDPGTFFAALDKGEPLRAIYDIYPQNVFNVVSLKGSGITKPADLKGKKIGVYSLASGTRQALQVLLHTAGLKESDVTVVVTGVLNFAPLMQGQVDATAATDTGLAIGRRRGLPDVNVIEVGKYLPVSSDLFVVTEKAYRAKRDLLQRFLRGYRDAMLWSIMKPEEAAHLAVKRAIDGTDPGLNLEIIKLRNASSESALTRSKGLGSLDVASLQAAADVYRKLGLIAKPLDVAKHVSQDLLPGAKGGKA